MSDGSMADRRKQNSAFACLILNADSGSAADLVDYLVSADTLSNKEATWLAWLIERKCPKKGRKEGTLDKRQAALQCINYLVRIGKEEWRIALGAQRLRNKDVEYALIQKAMGFVRREFPTEVERIELEKDRAGNITIDTQLSDMLMKVRPSKPIRDFVAEFLPDAIHEMKNITRE